MKKCYIMVGLPGSGKSTAAQELAKQSISNKIHSTDNYLFEDGVYVWKPEKMGWAHRKNLEDFSTSVKEGVEVVICDNTNVRPRDRKPYEQVAAENGYSVEYRMIGETSSEACELYAQRNTHGVTLEVITRMANTLSQNLP